MDCQDYYHLWIHPFLYYHTILWTVPLRKSTAIGRLFAIVHILVGSYWIIEKWSVRKFLLPKMLITSYCLFMQIFHQFHGCNQQFHACETNLQPFHRHKKHWFIWVCIPSSDITRHGMDVRQKKRSFPCENVVIPDIKFSKYIQCTPS